jgi:putative aminopeptidase FrvX
MPQTHKQPPTRKQPQQNEKLLLDLLALPTAPFCEQHVIAYIRAWVAARPNIELSSDRFANLRLRLVRGRPSKSPLVLAAHMDHPGFQAERMVGPGRVRAVWRGGVAPRYFKDAGVRFFTGGGFSTAAQSSPDGHSVGGRFSTGGQWVRGRIETFTVSNAGGREHVETIVAAVPAKVAAGSVGMWDLPEPRVRGTRLSARSCDDVAGVAAILAAFDTLARGRKPVDVYALLNRAEEVGFVGAIGGCRTRLVPRGGRVISMECSSAKAGATFGGGPILRVGDLSTIFTPNLTAWCRAVAGDLQKRRPEFRFQRKLMDGGTCEASAYNVFGYEATGLCVALGNYHNQGPRDRIAPEQIDLQDWHDMVDWFVALATSRRPYAADGQPFRKGIAKRERKWTPLLKRTAPLMGL